MVPPYSNKISRVSFYSKINEIYYPYGVITHYDLSFHTVQVAISINTGLICFRSPLLTESHFDVLSSRYLDVSVPWVCFLILIYKLIYFYKLGYRVCGGFSHSEIYGSKIIDISPQLIAVYYVLHRLSMPRHPRNSL